MAETKDHQESFTVELIVDDEDDEILENPTLIAPLYAMAEKSFTVTGKTPEPNQLVWIELEKTLIDEKLAEGMSNIDHDYEITIQLTEIGVSKIHAEVDRILLPNLTSPSRSILVLNMLTVGGILIVLAYLLHKSGLLKSLGEK